MPDFPINVLPGIFTDNSDRASINRWKNGNRVRFRSGVPQKLGGWQKESGGGSNQFTGIVRGIVDWKTLILERLVGLGSHLKLWLYGGGTYYDITPYRDSTSAFPPGSASTLTNPFSTTISDSVVTVAHTAHGVIVGTEVYFANVTNPVNGITIDGNYQVTEVVDSNTYRFDSSTAATATGGGLGGTVDWAYEINPGRIDQIAGLGWGAGAWGDETWDTPRSGSQIVLEPRLWSLDTWGEDLIANPRGGGIYLWDATDGTGMRSEILTNAPEECSFILVSPIDRYLIAYGCSPVGGGARDPLLIRWTDQGVNTTWTPAALNLAGTKRLDAGAEIIAAARTSQEILIFTDSTVLGQFQVGPPQVFGFRDLARGCGIMGQHAHVQYGLRTYWMGQSDFWFYQGGSVAILPCDVRNYVFDDINLEQKTKIHAGANQKFQEVWWFYCSAGSSEIDRYVAYNTVENSWHIGQMVRTSWLDNDEAFNFPAAPGVDGYLYLHELGNSDDGAAMGEFIETWDMELPGGEGFGQGEYLAKINKYHPDFDIQEGTLHLTMTARKYARGPTDTRGPTSFTGSTQFLVPRIRGRQISMRWDGDSAANDDFWRMGVPFTLEAKRHGKR